MPFSMPCQHATSSCHVTMPCHHSTSSCHVNRIHFLLPRGSLRECHVALQPKFSLLGPNFKKQYLLHLEPAWHAVCTVGIGLTSSSTWYYFCCNMMILKIGLFRSSRIINDPRGSKKENFQNHHIATKIVPCQRSRQSYSNGANDVSNGLRMQKILHFEVWPQQEKFWLKCHMALPQAATW